MKMKPIQYPYATSLTWTGEHKGTLSSEGKPDLSVACPPEWGGHPNIWSPEDLFVGSIEVCTMTTFLFLAEREKIDVRSYRSKAKTVAQMLDGDFGIPNVKVDVRIGVLKEEDGPTVERLMKEIEKWCLVSKSMRPEVIIRTKITVEEDRDQS